jgi:uncharacterized repeat protein (TIGR01451 family)
VEPDDGREPRISGLLSDTSHTHPTVEGATPMTQRVLHSILTYAVTATILVLAGCRCSTCKTVTADGSAPSAFTCTRSVVEGDKLRVWSAIPTGDPKTSVIMLEKIGPAEVSVGQEFAYDILVTNLSDCPLVDVFVTDRFSEGLELVAATPPALVSQDSRARWTLGELKGRETKQITARAVAGKEGDFLHCAQVTYLNTVCLEVRATTPRLELTKTMPERSDLLTPIPVTVVVTNTGTGTAQNVRITDNLPDGLVGPDNESTLQFPVGSLAPGESGQVEFEVRATKAGRINNTVVAAGDGGAHAQATAKVIVKQPNLKITKNAPAMRYIGRPIEYTITIRNPGNGPVQDAVLVDTLPTGTTLLAVSDGGTSDGEEVTWKIGTVKGGEERTFGLSVRPDAAGTVVNHASALAAGVDTVHARADTVVSGITAILLEVVDEADPVELGSEVTYIITATNQGSTAATNVRIAGVLEEQFHSVRLVGPTKGTSDGRVITFPALPQLGARQKAVWKVVAKAMKRGDARFRVELNTDQLERPVTETEATNVY